MKIRLLILLALFSLIGTGALLSACGGDDGGGGVSVLSPESEPDPEADPDPEAEVSTPEPKPADATQVDVTLAEWSVAPSVATVPAGQVYFLVTNEGPADEHEFVVVKSDLDPNALPVTEGKVTEDDVDIVDEIEPFAVSSSSSLTLDLEAGSYVLICNIAAEEDGALESHYENGMRTAFTVE